MKNSYLSDHNVLLYQSWKASEQLGAAHYAGPLLLSGQCGLSPKHALPHVDCGHPIPPWATLPYPQAGAKSSIWRRERQPGDTGSRSSSQARTQESDINPFSVGLQLDSSVLQQVTVPIVSFLLDFKCQKYFFLTVLQCGMDNLLDKKLRRANYR